MATTAAEHLALIDAVITKRLNGDAYVEYTEAEQRFRGESLESLYKIRATLQGEANAEAGGQLRLARINRA